MGKKKSSKNDDINETEDLVESEAPAKDPGGRKGKKSKQKSDWEDDVAKELEELSLESGIKLDKSSEIPKDNADKALENIPEDSKDQPNVAVKGKKSKKKKKGNDDEDIEEMLAELESEYRGEKPKEKIVPVENKIKDDEATPLNSKPLVNGELSQSVPSKKESEKKEKADKSKKKKTASADVPSKEKSKQLTPEPSKDEDDSKKKKKTKAEKQKEEEKAAKLKKGKPNKKMLEEIKEMQAKMKLEEERLKREEEERIKQEEERLRQIAEAKRLEEEEKERKRQKQKDRMKRLKEEGKYLTPKQKEQQKRARAMLEYLKAQGATIPGEGDKSATSSKKGKKKKQENQEEEEEAETISEEKMETEEIEEPTKEESDEKEDIEEAPQEEEEDDGVRDTWDQFSDSDEEDQQTKTSYQNGVSSKAKTVQPKEILSDEGESSDEMEHERMSEAVKRKERAKSKMEQRKIDNEQNRNPDILRAPVVCVLGHVDHGKTKILDKLRKTNVQEGEVGGITQQIGATNVPAEAVRAQTRMVKDFDINALKFPGLLIIDTPGHESFSNLRTRGSSLCDIAILVVDITQGLEPQTIESINLLKAKKTPFLVALNKVDRVFEWQSNPSKDIREIISSQNTPASNDFDKRKNEIIQALNEQGLNAALFWENPDPRSYVSLVPTSAITGDGMGNLISLICSMCQKRLFTKLMFSEELQCTVLEVKTIQGHGTTIDIILVNGRLREGDTIILAGTEGPIVTQIRSLLLPKPLKEIRVKGQYDEFKEVVAAQGVKIAAKELDKAIAGLTLQVAYNEEEIEILKEQVDHEFKSAMRSIKVKDKGVYVQASTLGALEALLEFFKANKVPYSGIRVGPVVKKDVMKAAAMKDHDPMYAVILAFDVKVEKDAQELADKEKIRIFSEETIYHLGDRYVEYIKDYKKKKQEEFKNVAVFPSKLKIIPTEVHNKRSPIILGVTVDSGVLRSGTLLCVPSKEFVEIGVVTSMEFDHKNVDLARKGVDVCIKIDPIPGHAPKLFGRHFDADDMLVSKISRESIDACKDHFRDDLNKTDWKLMAELKKLFQIL